MRISDWSSDVCSSDLRADVLARLADRHTRDQELQLLGDIGSGQAECTQPVLVELQPHCWHAVAPVELNSAHHRIVLHDRPEIVGESCRERVYQYVSISVAAASLKIKQKTKPTQ